MFFQAWALINITHLNCVLSSLNTCLPPQPCLFKPKRSSPTWTMSSGMQLLIPQPQPCLFELECSVHSSPHPNHVYLRAMSVSHPDHSIRARSLISHLDRVLGSATARPHVYYGSSLAPTMSLQAQLLASWPLCDFEPNGSCLTPSMLSRPRSLAPHPLVSFQAQRLVSRPYHDIPSPITCFWPPL